MMDIELVKRALEDADKIISLLNPYPESYIRDCQTARDQIAQALGELLKVPTTCEPAKIDETYKAMSKLRDEYDDILHRLTMFDDLCDDVMLILERSTTNE